MQACLCLCFEDEAVGAGCLVDSSLFWLITFFDVAMCAAAWCGAALLRNVGDEALLQLPKFPALSSLILRSTLATNDGLKPLGGVAHLQQLDLGSKWELNDAGRGHTAAAVCCICPCRQ